jgi:5'-nucleotidase
MRLTLLHTSDSHNRWSELFVNSLRTLKIQHGALLLDSGDAIRAGNVAIPLRPEPAWEWMRMAGYDAVTLGNREFHLTAAGFLAKTRGAPCPLLCANLRPKDSKVPVPVQPLWRTEQHGIRIAVLGLTVPMVTARMRAAMFSAYLFDPPLETARAWATLLRPEVDLLIALTHLGIQHDRLLAEACPELDVILGGHSHTPTESPERVQGVWLSHAPPFCTGATLLTLTPCHDRWRIEWSLSVRLETDV